MNQVRKELKDEITYRESIITANEKEMSGLQESTNIQRTRINELKEELRMTRYQRILVNG